MTTLLIVCLVLLLSSLSACAHSGDKAKKKESSSSQQTDEKKDDQTKREGDKKVGENSDEASKTADRRRTEGIGSDAIGKLAKTSAEGADKTSTSQAAESSAGDKDEDSETGDAAASKSTVQAGSPLVTGTIDKADIQKVIKSNREPIAACYEQRLKEKPQLAGLIKVKFTISGSGDVIAALVQKSSELKDRKLQACLVHEIQSWMFPKPKGGGIVIVNYPFNFSTTDK